MRDIFFEDEWDYLAENVEPSFTKWYAPIMYFLCRAEEVRRAVEIGSFRGYTTIVLAKCMEKNNGRLVAIESNEVYAKELEDKLNNLNLMPYVEIVVESSQEYTLKEKVSFVFVDGDKTYDGMKSDIKRYSPYVVNGGYMCVHDYKVPVCREAIEDGFNWICWDKVKLTKGYGLVIARKVI